MLIILGINELVLLITTSYENKFEERNLMRPRLVLLLTYVHAKTTKLEVYLM